MTCTGSGAAPASAHRPQTMGQTVKGRGQVSALLGEVIRSTVVSVGIQDTVLQRSMVCHAPESRTNPRVVSYI